MRATEEPLIMRRTNRLDELRAPLLPQQNNDTGSDADEHEAPDDDDRIVAMEGRASSASSSAINRATCNDRQGTPEERDDDDPDGPHPSPPNQPRATLLFFVLGRGTLLLCACLYASMNVCFRYLYASHGPPTASTMNSARGWIVLASFVPFLAAQKRRSKRSINNHNTGENNAGDGINNDSNTDTAGEGEMSEQGVSSQQEVQEENSTTEDPEQAAIIISSAINDNNEEQEHQEQNNNNTSSSLFKVALELAFWNFLSQALNTWGLLTTPSARASFLGQTTVVMVPLIAAGWLGQALPYMVLAGCVTSFCGLLCLSYDDLRDAQALSTMGLGDGLILLGAFCWSLYIIRISQTASHFDSVKLQAAKNFILAILYTLWLVVAVGASISETAEETEVEEGHQHHHLVDLLWPGWQNPLAWIVLTYSAVGPGTMADLLQQYGQEKVPATEANLILSMEPVFTSIMGRALLGETTSWLDKVGGFFLMAGAVIASI